MGIYFSQCNPLLPDHLYIFIFTQQGLGSQPLPFKCSILPRSDHHAEMISYQFKEAAETLSQFESQLSGEDRAFVEKQREELGVHVWCWYGNVRPVRSYGTFRNDFVWFYMHWDMLSGEHVLYWVVYIQKGYKVRWDLGIRWWAITGWYCGQQVFALAQGRYSNNDAPSLTLGWHQCSPNSSRPRAPSFTQIPTLPAGQRNSAQPFAPMVISPSLQPRTSVHFSPAWDYR